MTSPGWKFLGHTTTVDFARVQALLADWGEPGYRGRQVDPGRDLGPRRRVRRHDLVAAGAAPAGWSRPSRSTSLPWTPSSGPGDGTIKLRLPLGTASRVEAVAMRHRNRRTVCVSSQSGCALACTFCATGHGSGPQPEGGGDPEQVLVLARRAAADRRSACRNVVMMGMGEPFPNYDHVLVGLPDAQRPRGVRPGRPPDRDLDGGLGSRDPAAGRRAAADQAGALAARPRRPAAHAADAVHRRFPLERCMAACRDYRELHRAAASSSSTCCWTASTTPTTQADQLASLLGGPSGVPRQPDRLQPDRLAYWARRRRAPCGLRAGGSTRRWALAPAIAGRTARTSTPPAASWWCRASRAAPPRRRAGPGRWRCKSVCRPRVAPTPVAPRWRQGARCRCG